MHNYAAVSAWSLILKEELRLRVLDNGVQRKIHESKGDEVTEWRGLHNEELYVLHS